MHRKNGQKRWPRADVDMKFCDGQYSGGQKTIFLFFKGMGITETHNKNLKIDVNFDSNPFSTNQQANYLIDSIITHNNTTKIQKCN
jgi:hypothetical protein